jgi:hypothetical protein
MEVDALVPRGKFLLMAALAMVVIVALIEVVAAVFVR